MTDIGLDHVTHRFAIGRKTITALADVTIAFPSGGFHALIGPSGCGKSTILRLVLGFEFPESGSIRYDGLDLAGLDVQAEQPRINVGAEGVNIMQEQVLELWAFGQQPQRARPAGIDIGDPGLVHG